MMNTKSRYAFIAMMISSLFYTAPQTSGVLMPWTNTEAETMTTDGTLMGPAYEPYRVETESSGQRYVKLMENGQWVGCAAPMNANCMVIHFSVSDHNQDR